MTLDEFEERLADDTNLYHRLIAIRGGCRCCISPPCSACSAPLTEMEAEYLGWERPEFAEPVDIWKAVRDACR